MPHDAIAEARTWIKQHRAKPSDHAPYLTPITLHQDHHTECHEDRSDLAALYIPETDAPHCYDIYDVTNRDTAGNWRKLGTVEAHGHVAAAIEASQRGQIPPNTCIYVQDLGRLDP